MPLPLIATPMYFGTVLDALEQLLKDESANQINLGGEGWTTVKERFSPWDTNEFPIVNIVYNSGSFDKSAGSHSDQTHAGAYLIDCYNRADAVESAGNITPMDESAAIGLHLLVTKIYYSLMTEVNRDIGLPIGKVVSPWVDRIEKFIPTENNVPVEGIIAMRITLSMNFKEFPPIGTGADLETLEVITDTDEGGLVEQTFDNLQS